jgi:hypothetical protein
MPRHSQETIGATIILLFCGSALLALSRRAGVGSDLMSQLAALAGPTAIVLGIGAAVHGKDMPPTGITFKARVWGLLGSAAAFANLWTLGYFNQGEPAGRAARWLLPLALVVAWLLPALAYGGDVSAASSSASAG